MNKMIFSALMIGFMAVPLTAAQAQNQDALCSLRSQAMRGAAYQPGVDVNGNPVAPASADASMQALPDTIHIPMTVDLANSFQGKLPAGTEMQAATGMIEIHGDGKVVFNGQDLSESVDALCKESNMKKAAIEQARQIAKEGYDTPPATEPAAMPKPAAAPVPAVTKQPAPTPAPAPAAVAQPAPVPVAPPPVVSTPPAPAPVPTTPAPVTAPPMEVVPSATGRAPAPPPMMDPAPAMPESAVEDVTENPGEPVIWGEGE